VEALPQTLLFGVLRSGLYALTALGLAISLGVIGVVNFAHGEFVMLGAYIGFWLYLLLSGPLGLGPAVSPLVIIVGIPLSAVALYLVATGIYRLTLRPVLRQPELNQMLLTFGLSILFVNGTSIALSPQARDANLDWRFDVFDLGFASVTYARLAVFVVCIALVLASVPMGLLFAQQRRITGGIQAPMLTHVVWSTLMLRYLPPLFARFYDDVASTVDIRVPQRYYSAMDKAAGDYLILLEDITDALLLSQTVSIRHHDGTNLLDRG